MNTDHLIFFLEHVVMFYNLEVNSCVWGKQIRIRAVMRAYAIIITTVIACHQKVSDPREHMLKYN